MASGLSTRRKVANVVVVAVILGIIGGVLYLARNNAANADVGDCLRSTGSTSLEQVGCDDPAATYEVVGKVEGKREGEADSSLCGEFKDAEQVYWMGSMGKRGTVLCLAPTGG
jgi:hypothetical protein